MKLRTTKLLMTIGVIGALAAPAGAQAAGADDTAPQVHRGGVTEVRHHAKKKVHKHKKHRARHVRRADDATAAARRARGADDPAGDDRGAVRGGGLDDPAGHV
jgi:Ni/Co efflux regulator RcnB